MPPGQILTSQTVHWTRPQNSPTSCGKCHGLEGGKQRRKESRGKTGFGGEKKTFDEMFDLSTEQASKFVRELAFPEERHRTTWRNEKKKPTKKSLVTVPPFVCQMWKYLHITLRTESFKKKKKRKPFSLDLHSNQSSPGRLSLSKPGAVAMKKVTFQFLSSTLTGSLHMSTVAQGGAIINGWQGRFSSKTNWINEIHSSWLSV